MQEIGDIIYMRESMCFHMGTLVGSPTFVWGRLGIWGRPHILYCPNPDIPTL